MNAKIVLFLLILLPSILKAQATFEKYFLEKTLRFDYYNCGSQNEETYFFDELKEEPYWAGSKVSLLDTTGYGVQMFKIIDVSILTARLSAMSSMRTTKLSARLSLRI